MNQKSSDYTPYNYILLGLTLVALLLLFVSYSFDYDGEPVRSITSYVFVPMQNGLDYVGSLLSITSDDFKTKQDLIAENEELRQQISDLTNQINTMQLEQTELEELQSLLELSRQYDYETTAARVIGQGSSNWFDTFTINKGSDDGIEVGMNVMADGGLVGIVTEVGTNYAYVRSIIDDTSSVSGMFLTTDDTCIVSGSLSSMSTDYTISFSNLDDQDDLVQIGDAIVTSNISDKYMPGILIGYVTTISDDTNKLTKSGTVTPVVDFEHLTDVLVILELKVTIGATEE